MTVKYATATARAEAKVRAATHALTEAQIRLARANARGLTAADAYEAWAEKWPQLAEVEGRPLYEGPDGIAVSGEGEAVWIEDGQSMRQANTPDIYQPPPPTSEELDALESAVEKAEKALTKATTAAAKVEPETQKPTGYAVVKAGRIGGTYFASGDPFPPELVTPVKFDQLLSRRHIRRVSNVS